MVRRVLGLWDVPALEPDKEHLTISVSGAYGGKTVDFRALAHEGITLVGMTKAFENGTVTFEDDLVGNVEYGDKNYLDVLDQADAYIIKHGLDLPEDPEARVQLSDPDCLTNPVLELDLKAGVSSIIWATGYSQDFSWIKEDVLGENNKPKHSRGVSSEPGIYFLGLPWQSRRGSSFIWGVWHDAKYIADQIEIQRNYQAYRAPR